MSDTRTEAFLDTYRRLEAAAAELLGNYGSPVHRMEQHPDFAEYAQQLESIRGVRNFLSHEPKFNGEYAIHPSQTMCRALEDILDAVEHPPRVAERMTPLIRLTTAARDTQVLPLMKEMERRHISHVPILDNGRVESVFSVTTVFQAALDGELYINADTCVGEFDTFLPIDRHMGQEFRFVSPDLPQKSARTLFQQRNGKHGKLKLLLVTDDGTAKGQLCGVVSPYDILNGG